MKKKITRSSFSALRETARLMDEREQRAVIGGDYWDDHGIWSTDSSGNNYWTRTSQGDGYYYGGSYGGSSGNNSGSCCFSQSEFFNWQGYWPGGFVEGMGYVSADVTITGYNPNDFSPNTGIAEYDFMYLGGFQAGFKAGLSGTGWDDLGVGLWSAISAASAGSDFGDVNYSMIWYSKGLKDGLMKGREARNY